MSTQFQVDTQQIQVGSADLERMAGRLEEDLVGMNRAVETLMNVWRGAAASGFSHSAQAWAAAQRQMHEALLSMRTALQNAGHQYTETEAANAALFRS